MTDISKAADALGRKGGASKSEAKQAASRANGARPKMREKYTITIDGGQVYAAATAQNAANITIDSHQHGNNPSITILVMKDGDPRVKMLSSVAVLAALESCDHMTHAARVAYFGGKLKAITRVLAEG